MLFSYNEIKDREYFLRWPYPGWHECFLLKNQAYVGLGMDYKSVLEN